MFYRKGLFSVFAIIVLLTGVYFRASGLFRGLEEGVVFHPDSPKQVMALHNYLEGNYVQYYESLFYDGYPYGLNRVDEVFLRAWRRISRVFQDVLFTGAGGAVGQGRSQLYYQGRTLRVLYGIAVMGLLYASASFLWGRWYGIGAAGIYGLAPLGATVTHSVTGDIGVDLFLAVLLFAGSRFVRAGHLRWFVVMGVACGMGFVCKFQGVLGIWIVLVLATGGVWHNDALRLARVWQACLLAVTGFVSGVLLLNPAFLVDPTRTWRFMRQNFIFIKNYNVPAEFLALPLREKIVHGVSRNLLPIIGHVGVVIFVLAVIALLLVCFSLFRLLSRKDRLRGFKLRQLLYVFGLVSFAIGSLLLATALKQVVQPFHFSFLLPALALASVWCVRSIMGREHRAWRIVAVVLSVLACGELLVGSVAEDYFWRRPENARLGTRHGIVVAGNPGLGTDRIEDAGLSNVFYTERATKPVFRNRPSGMRAPTAWWLSHTMLPYPPVPYPAEQHWIFMHGADFPRSTRMFEVPAGKRAHRTLVFRETPSQIRLGLQTGYLPARFKVESGGGEEVDGFLAQNSQKILMLDHLDPAYVQDTGSDLLRVIGFPIKVDSALGPVWVTVLEDDFAEARFWYFGAMPAEMEEKVGPLQALLALTRDDEYAPALAPLRYYDNDARMRVTSDFMPLPGADPLPLAAGGFVLNLQMGAVTQSNRLYLRYARGLKAQDQITYAVDLEPGMRTLAWTFSKEYAPYDGVLAIRADQPGIEITDWSLRPDPERMADFQPRVQDETWNESTDLAIIYPDLGVLQALAITLTNDLPRYAVRFDLDPEIRQRLFDNAVVFLHVKNEIGEMVSAWDIPLWATTLTDERVLWHAGEGLPPGRYHVDGGIYHIRNRLRFRFRKPEGINTNLRRKYARLAEFDVP